jgi:hypothetical protein
MSSSFCVHPCEGTAWMQGGKVLLLPALGHFWVQKWCSSSGARSRLQRPHALQQLCAPWVGQNTNAEGTAGEEDSVQPWPAWQCALPCRHAGMPNCLVWRCNMRSTCVEPLRQSCCLSALVAVLQPDPIGRPGIAPRGMPCFALHIQAPDLWAFRSAPVGLCWLPCSLSPPKQPL